MRSDRCGLGVLERSPVKGFVNIKELVVGSVLGGLRGRREGFSSENGLEEGDRLSL